VAASWEPASREEISSTAGASAERRVEKPEDPPLVERGVFDVDLVALLRFVGRSLVSRRLVSRRSRGIIRVSIRSLIRNSLWLD